MLDELLEIFERDKKKASSSSAGGLRGRLARVLDGDRDDDRSRDRDDDRYRSRDRDDDRYRANHRDDERYRERDHDDDDRYSKRKKKREFDFLDFGD